MNAVERVCGAIVVVALACGTGRAFAAVEPDGARAATDRKDAGAATAVDSRPEQLRDVGIDQHLDAPLPLDLQFRDEQGATVRLGQYFGDKPVVLSLVYYECPMLCTLVLNGLVRAMNALTFDAGKEFEVVTVSFNPEDTPELAAAKKETYLRSYPRPGAAAGWHFLTGDQAEIAALTRAIGFRYRWVPEQRQYAHAAGIVVATPQGRLARYFYGLEYSARDLRLGLVEASQGKIGSPVDTVLLYCFAYDPASGTYAATALNAVRIGGVVTVLALGGFLVTSVRRERRSAGR